MAWLAGLLLGPVVGAASQIFYLGLGLFVVPVFGNGGGTGYVALPTFGYLIGLVPAAFLAGRFRGGVRRTAFGLLTGQLALDACGVGYQLLLAHRGGLHLWFSTFAALAPMLAMQLPAMGLLALVLGPLLPRKT